MSSVSSAAAGGHPVRSRPGQADPTSLTLTPHFTGGGLSPSATPLYLPAKLEPGASSLFSAEDVMRCVASTVPRRLVSTPLVASSQVLS